MTEEYISIEEKLSKKISGHFAAQLGLSPIEQAKVEYGLSILFVDLFKMMVMYAIAFLLHIVGAVFITHLVFISVRFTTKGVHASNSAVCTILSVLFLVVLPWITASIGFELTRPLFSLGILLVGLGVFVKERTINKTNGPFQLKKTVLIIMFITTIGLLLPSDSIRTYLLLGLAIATLLMFIKNKGVD
ncbi:MULTISPECIES: accessory gene regulator B family protein [unclassified Enterococcus]|uniref:accessory gene regulator B family protein n=1 Tax=unclassified Enterococcus TaxID=2608891 RepID=UPI001A9B394A|nr:accessory gene regulator B family protein [Enterococcus sp. DIV1271a]MBO1301369.1 accessory gene regulator B family protein [Enterococcus sp. DIV1271a]